MCNIIRPVGALRRHARRSPQQHGVLLRLSVTFRFGTNRHARRENTKQTRYKATSNTDEYTRFARLRECVHLRHGRVPEVWSHSAPRQLLVGFSNDAALLAQTPPEQLSSPDSSSDHRRTPRCQHASTRPPSVRGTPADGGAILQRFGVMNAMRLDDEARGAQERAVCGIAWVCMGFGIVVLGRGRDST